MSRCKHCSAAAKSPSRSHRDSRIPENANLQGCHKRIYYSDTRKHPLQKALVSSLIFPSFLSSLSSFLSFLLIKVTHVIISLQPWESPFISLVYGFADDPFCHHYFM